MREKIKTLDKNNEKLKLNKKAKKQKLKQRGITLIALVVTIIILLILAGVTLNIALSDNGLFGKAKKAAEDYKQAQSEEEDLINQFATQLYSEYVGAEVIGYQPTEKTITIEGTKTGLENNQKDDQGNTFDEVKENGNQEFSTEEMKWRVWDFDGNTLRIIGDHTKKYLVLKGIEGYNNGVYVMNEICRQCYGQYEEDGTMKQGISVSNLRRSDIQRIQTFDYESYEDQNDLGISKFGAEKKYSNDNYNYPKMWEENDKNWIYTNQNGLKKGDKNCLIWENEGNGNLLGETETGHDETFKSSYWGFEFYGKPEMFVNQKYYEILFPSEDPINNPCWCWLSTRVVNVRGDSITFGLCNLDNFTYWNGEGHNRVQANTLYTMGNGEVNGTDRSVRPIVTIDLKKSGFELEEKNENGIKSFVLT